MAQIITSRNVQLYQTTAIETDPTNLLYAGARDIKWQVDLLPPKTRIYLYINNIPLSDIYVKSLGQTYGDPVYTDDFGSATGFLIIPSNSEFSFSTGQIKISFADNADDLARSTFLAENNFSAGGYDRVDTNQTDTRSTRQTVKFRQVNDSSLAQPAARDLRQTKSTNTLDPLGQTFNVDANEYPNGLYVTSVDLYFAARDNEAVIAVDLRPTINGAPVSNEYYSGTYVVKTPSQVNIPEDTGPGGVDLDENPNTITTTTYLGKSLGPATNFAFDHAIYLKPGTYAICVYTNSTKYYLYTAIKGTRILGSTATSAGNEGRVGALYRPQNISSRVSDQNEDLCFTLYKAKFNVGSVTWNLRSKAFPAKVEYDSFLLKETSINYGGVTDVKFKVTPTILDGGLAAPINILPEDIIYGAEKYEANVAGDIKFDITMVNNSPDVSPTVDLEKFATMLFVNIVDPYEADLSETELNPVNGESRSKYISKVISLEKGSSSTELQVQLEINRKVGTDIEVYAKLISENDSSEGDVLQQRNWKRLALVTGNKKFTAGNEFTLETYQLLEDDVAYTANSSIAGQTTQSRYTSFNKYQIKVVFYSLYSTAIPRIRKLFAAPSNVITLDDTGGGITVGAPGSVARAISRAMPPGAVIGWANTNPPVGFLSCNGAAVSRITFSKLFATVGTAFGAGDGTYTFNVPNLVNRTMVGSGGLYPLANIGGSKDAIVVAHTHALTDNGHRHSYVTKGGTAVQSGSTTACWFQEASAFTSNAYSNISINEAGESGTNKNMMPYQALHYIIKA